MFHCLDCGLFKAVNLGVLLVFRLWLVSSGKLGSVVSVSLFRLWLV